MTTGSAGIVSEYAHQWYTWVIGGIFLGILLCVAYFKVLKPRWLASRSRSSLSSIENGQETNRLLKSGKKNHGEYGGIVSYSTDMIPDTPNPGYSYWGYQFLHQKWRSFIEQFSKNNKENESISSIMDSNHSSGDLSKLLVKEETNNNNINNNNINLKIEKNINFNNILNDKEVRLEESLLKCEKNTFLKNNNNIGYESLHRMPMNERVIDKINNTSVINEFDNNNNNTFNDKGDKKNYNRLFRVNIEGHSPKKIPFIRANNNINILKKQRIVSTLNDGYGNNYDSSDSGVYTDDMNSENDNQRINNEMSSSDNSDGVLIGDNEYDEYNEYNDDDSYQSDYNYEQYF